MQQGTTHIIGAGLAGLSAATRLASLGKSVIVYEATGQAGGRCRSYYDSAFGAVIDNGNHLLLSGNHSALSYLRRIGANMDFAHAKKPNFDFTDAKTKAHWSLRLNNGKLPWWLLSKSRRLPGTRAVDYVSVLSLLRSKPEQTVTQLLKSDTVLYKNLWEPLLISALNTDPEEASAMLAGAITRGTLLKGGYACIPLVAEGLSSVFIEPALAYLQACGNTVLFNHRLRHITFANNKAVMLDFMESKIRLAPEDNVICAVPSWNVAALLPGTTAPTEYRSILNAHFSVIPPADFPKILGVINANIEWIFSFPGRISITISNADRFMAHEREALAVMLWQEIASITGLSTTLPPWQIVKEKRATFAATPAQNAQRPTTATTWDNVYLAGDGVQTGLPATIEGAVLSGVWAANFIARKQ